MPARIYDFRNIDQMRREKAANDCEDISRIKVAHTLNISANTYYRYIRETVSDPPQRIVDAICAYFGVKESVFRINGGDDETLENRGAPLRIPVGA